MKCKDCARYKDEWCEKIADSLDEEMERECEHFVQRKGGGRSVTVTRAQAETMRREWHVGMADSFGTLIHCSECGNGTNFGNVKKWMEDERHQFCGVCGAPMTDKAMDRLWKRLEEAMSETETD